MNTVEATVEIDAPLEEVFRFVADSSNVLGFMDNVVSFEPSGSETYGLGSRFRWTTVMKGFALGTEFEVVEFDPPYGMAARSVAGVPSASRWHFAPAAERTLATFVASYAVPGSAVVRRLAHLFRLEAEIEASVVKSLRNLKHIMEKKRQQTTVPAS